MRADVVASGASHRLVARRAEDRKTSVPADDLRSCSIRSRRGRFRLQPSFRSRPEAVTLSESHQAEFVPRTVWITGISGSESAAAIRQPEQACQHDGERQSANQANYRFPEKTDADRAGERQDREQDAGGSRRAGRVRHVAAHAMAGDVAPVMVKNPLTSLVRSAASFTTYMRSHEQRNRVTPMPYVTDRAMLADATDLIARFGTEAAFQAAALADRSRDRGNVLHFCRWRQVERLVAILVADEVTATIH